MLPGWIMLFIWLIVVGGFVAAVVIWYKLYYKHIRRCKLYYDSMGDQMIGPTNISIESINKLSVAIVDNRYINNFNLDNVVNTNGKEESLEKGILVKSTVDNNGKKEEHTENTDGWTNEYNQDDYYA